MAPDPEAYGELLWTALFGDPGVAEAFAQARAHAGAHTDEHGQTRPLPLRLRLYISGGTPELHALRWETLRDPVDHAWLVTSERVLFSRYLAPEVAMPHFPRVMSDSKVPLPWPGAGRI